MKMTEDDDEDVQKVYLTIKLPSWFINAFVRTNQAVLNGDDDAVDAYNTISFQDIPPEWIFVKRRRSGGEFPISNLLKDDFEREEDMSMSKKEWEDDWDEEEGWL